MTNFKLFSFCIITTLGFTYGSNNYAADNPASNQPFDFYFGISTGQSELELEDEKGDVNIAKFKGGVFLQENVALELSFGQGLSDTRLENSIDAIDIDSWYSLQLRLQSPQQQGFRLYFQGGYSQIELSESIPFGSTGRVDSLSGGTISAGIEQNILKNSPWWVYLDFSKTKDDIDVRFLDFGIRIDI